MPVTITAFSADGKQHTVSIDKTAPVKGTVQIDTSSYDIYDIKSAADGSKLVCRGDVFGPDPTVTVEAHPASGAKPSFLRVTIEGALAGNGTTEYTLTDADQKKVRDFVVSCHFPPV